MRKRKRKIILVLVVLLLILFIAYPFIKYDFLQEDLIFFQFFHSIKQSENPKIKNETQNMDVQREDVKQENANTNIMQLHFMMQYKDVQLKDVNLCQTVDNQTLVYEKIAPGTSGNFDIVLNSIEDMHYEIQFESKNDKPSNLQFYTSENSKKYDTLEALDDTLKGKVLKNEKKIIHINWEWCYETSKEKNQQDTEEAKKIREYHFSIYVKGY